MKMTDSEMYDEYQKLFLEFYEIIGLHWEAALLAGSEIDKLNQDWRDEDDL